VFVNEDEDCCREEIVVVPVLDGAGNFDDATDGAKREWGVNGVFSRRMVGVLFPFRGELIRHGCCASRLFGGGVWLLNFKNRV